MKRISLLAMVASAAIGMTQSLPIELESHRKPTTVTHGNCLIKGGRVLTASHGTLENTDVLVEHGKIVKIGRRLSAPSGFTVIDASNKVVAPGIVDAHSHRAADGTNEGTDSITAEVRIADVMNMSSLTAWQALASGHTTAMILHGSANPVGGQSQVVKYKYLKSNTEAVVPDAPRMIKFALGENVTRKTDTTGSRYPRTRMGVESVYRRAFTEAKRYAAEWDDFNAGKTKKRPRRDLRLETLSDILKRKIWVQCHSYRSDEILMMVRLSQEFGFKIGAMQHALESYKIAPELAKAGVGVSIFSDSWSFKQEGYDAIPFAASILNRAGVNVSLNTDGVSGTTALNIDAAKTMRYGGLSEDEALRLITLNPAKQLGVDHRTGSIDVNKDADIAIWEGHPLSVYSRCAMTMIEGDVYFERRDAFGINRVATTKNVLDRKSNFRDTPVPPVSETYAIVDATVHPVSAPVMEHGTVVVSKGKITAVGTDVRIPQGAREINGRGLHVYPGFIDGYSSIGLLEISPIPVMVDNSESGTNQADLDALTAIWCESAHFGAARYNGVTNAFSAPAGGSISGQGALLNTDGYTTEQFGFQRKAALVVNFAGGAPRGSEMDRCDGNDDEILMGLLGIKSIDELNLDRREKYFDMLGGAPVQGFDGGFDTGGGASIGSYFDKALAYMKKREAEPNTPIDLTMEAMIPYVKGERLVILNARSASSIRNAVAFGKKYKLKIAIGGGSEAWKEARLLRANRVPVILSPAGRTILSANTTDQLWDPYDTPYANAGILARAGVKICFQSASGADVMNLPVRVGEDCAFGLSQDDAIRALTLSAAEIFGVADRLGSIEPGKVANIVVTDGDPFELTSTYRYVFINGQPRPLVSKHTMLRDKYSVRK